MLNFSTNLGSHVLIGYENKSGQVEVVVWLLGLLAYRVVLAHKKPNVCSDNFLFTELRIDSSRRELTHKNREDANNIFWNALNSSDIYQTYEVAGLKMMVPREMIAPLKYIDLYPTVMNLVQYFENANDDTKGPNEVVNDILLSQLKNITQASSLHKKSVKRFVNDIFRDGHEPIILNTKTSNKKSTMLFYCVFLVGKMKEELTDYSFHKLVKNEFASSEDIIVTDELEEQLKEKIITDDKYSEILERGARLIKKWQ